MTMTFDQFQKNVHKWSEDRGIYEHSTPLAQSLKAVSEVGELCDAVLKGDIDGIKDAIGDIAVCLVNVAKMLGQKDLDLPVTGSYTSAHISAAEVSVAAADITARIDACAPTESLLTELVCCANTNNLNFLDCCESAWNEIKDRKGHMVASGAFVKEK